MKAPVIVDLRNIYKPEEMEKYGFSHFPIGKRTPKA
jgi:UDPglucose 6-dehydrogenase